MHIDGVLIRPNPTPLLLTTLTSLSIAISEIPSPETTHTASTLIAQLRRLNTMAPRVLLLAVDNSDVSGRVGLLANLRVASKLVLAASRPLRHKPGTRSTCGEAGAHQQAAPDRRHRCSVTLRLPLLVSALSLQSSEEVLEWAINNVYKEGDEVGPLVLDCRLASPNIEAHASN